MDLAHQLSPGLLNTTLQMRERRVCSTGQKGRNHLPQGMKYSGEKAQGSHSRHLICRAGCIQGQSLYVEYRPQAEKAPDLFVNDEGLLHHRIVQSYWVFLENLSCWQSLQEFRPQHTLFALVALEKTLQT